MIYTLINKCLSEINSCDTVQYTYFTLEYIVEDFMDSQVLKLARYIKKIMPLKRDLSESYKKIIENLPSKSVSLFVATENMSKELAVYYMLTHNMISYTEYVLAEELVDMKFNRANKNKNCYDLYSDSFIIDMSSLTKNNMSFSIINSFVKYALNIPTNRCIVVFFKGDRRSYSEYSKTQQNSLEVDQCVFLDDLVFKENPTDYKEGLVDCKKDFTEFEDFGDYTDHVDLDKTSEIEERIDRGDEHSYSKSELNKSKRNRQNSSKKDKSKTQSYLNNKKNGKFDRNDRPEY